MKENPPKSAKNPPNKDLEVKTELELKTKQEANLPTQPESKPNPKTKPTPLNIIKTLKKPGKIAQQGRLQEKIRKFSSKSPPKLPTTNQTSTKQTTNKPNQNQTQNINTGTGTKQENTTKPTRDTKTLMELIKQKQTEKQHQQRETKQQKTTRQKHKQNESKQPNKTRKTKQEDEKPNLPRITMYLTKNSNQIEARAAALQPVNQVDVTTQPSKDATSASSIGYNKPVGIQPEL